MRELSWVFERASDRVVVVVTGAMTAGTSTEFEAALVAVAAVTDVVVDLRAVNPGETKPAQVRNGEQLQLA